MKSIANYYNTMIDMRSLVLSGTYIRLNEHLAEDLCIEWYDYINNLLSGECVLDWQFNRRCVSDIRKAIVDKKGRNDHFTLSMNGNVICDEIYNKTTLRAHNKKIMFPVVPNQQIISDGSEDYKEVYNRLLSKDDNNAIRETVLDIFNIENKIPYGYTIQSDITALFSCAPLKDSGEFWGKFSFSISAYCIDREVDYYANRFALFIRDCLAKYPFLNAHISLDYYDDSYSRYYGRYPVDCVRSYWNDSIGSYFSSVYTMEIGWANYICKESSRLGIRGNNRDNSQITVDRMSNGGYWIQGRNQITAQDVNLLKEIKQCLYNVILPRKNVLGRHRAFRKYWELVPVFENEISVDNEGVTFCHKGTINASYVYDVLNIPCDNKFV